MPRAPMALRRCPLTYPYLSDFGFVSQNLFFSRAQIALDFPKFGDSADVNDPESDGPDVSESATDWTQGFIAATVSHIGSGFEDGTVRKWLTGLGILFDTTCDRILKKNQGIVNDRIHC